MTLITGLFYCSTISTPLQNMLAFIFIHCTSRGCNEDESTTRSASQIPIDTSVGEKHCDFSMLLKDLMHFAITKQSIVVYRLHFYPHHILHGSTGNYTHVTMMTVTRRMRIKCTNWE